MRKCEPQHSFLSREAAHTADYWKYALRHNPQGIIHKVPDLEEMFRYAFGRCAIQAGIHTEEDFTLGSLRKGIVLAMAPSETRKSRRGDHREASLRSETHGARDRGVG